MFVFWFALVAPGLLSFNIHRNGIVMLIILEIFCMALLRQPPLLPFFPVLILSLTLYQSCRLPPLHVSYLLPFFGLFSLHGVGTVVPAVFYFFSFPQS